jgi:hypothetical protein
LVGIGLGELPKFPTYQPDVVSGVTFRPTILKAFKAKGLLNKNLHLNGEYYDKAYWYYEPDIDTSTGSGQIVFEITNDNKQSFGFETEGATLGVILNYLNADRQVVYSLDARVTMSQPAYALVYPVSETPELWASVKYVALRPYIINFPIGSNWGLVVNGTF